MQIFKILGVLITLLVCVSGSYATNPNEVNTADNINLQQADQTTTDLGYISDDSGADDSGADDSGADDSYTVDPVYEPLGSAYRTLTLEKFSADDQGTDDSNADDSGSDNTNPTDIYYTLATSELADGNTPLAAGSDEIDDPGVDDSDNGSGDVYDNGIDDGSSDDNGTDEYTLTAEQTGLAGNGGNGGDGRDLSENANLTNANSIPMQHTGLPVLPALLGVLSLVGGFAINKNRS
jgi:hypothetical protein